MAEKLYKFDVPRDQLIHPKDYDGSWSPPKWWSGKFISCDTRFFDVLKKLNPKVTIAKADSDDVKIVVASEKPDTDGKIRKAIRNKYSVEQELEALRESDKTVLDDIAKIKTEIT